MVLNISLDEKSEKELKELAHALKVSRSFLIRKAINDFYLKEKRAKESLMFYVDLYNEGAIDRDVLFLLLPRTDAEAVIIGSKTGKEAAKIVQEINS
tara:strand:- start:143 stop:433 length:291 start_codon:yes stop_codon:yes gene_type:complete